MENEIEHDKVESGFQSYSGKSLQRDDFSRDLDNVNK